MNRLHGDTCLEIIVIVIVCANGLVIAKGRLDRLILEELKST